MDGRPQTSHGSKFLLVRSQEEEFPVAALNEIRDERMADDEETAFPPCRVEIVLGMKGRLFVVPGHWRLPLYYPSPAMRPFYSRPSTSRNQGPRNIAYQQVAAEALWSASCRRDARLGE